jgi:hypothetical protein
MGYTRIQGALKNLGHRVARSTVAAILKEHGIPPCGTRSTSWRTFLRAHWRAIVAADFFATEVWTTRGLVTFYTVFVIELHSRRVQIVGSTTAVRVGSAAKLGSTTPAARLSELYPAAGPIHGHMPRRGL